MRRHNNLIPVTLALLLASCGGEPRPAEVTEPIPVENVDEASGVTYHDGALYIVDDSIPSSYFRVPIPPRSRGLIRINELSPEKVTLPIIGPFVDLEAIDRLADGRIVALSERLRCIVAGQGIVAEYDYPLGEVGRRGLEGLAVRKLAGGISRVAVLWEGGYPDVGSLHPQLQNLIGGRTLAPLIFVHDLSRNETVGRVRWNEGVAQFMLKPPNPPGEEPIAQRFRAPDLVWYGGTEKTSGEWGYIVLLSSQNAVDQPEFLHHWLQRFDANGKPVGEAFDIAANTPPDIASSNWEGLSWYEEGKSLVLVHEGRGDLRPNAFILDLPENWRYTPPE